MANSGISPLITNNEKRKKKEKDSPPLQTVSND
jgi:hypothetical protein